MKDHQMDWSELMYKYITATITDEEMRELENQKAQCKFKQREFVVLHNPNRLLKEIKNETIIKTRANTAHKRIDEHKKRYHENPKTIGWILLILSVILFSYLSCR